MVEVVVGQMPVRVDFAVVWRNAVLHVVYARLRDEDEPLGDLVVLPVRLGLEDALGHLLELDEVVVGYERPSKVS